MVKDHKYTMWLDKEEKNRLTEWGKTQGFTSFAKLIEASLDVVQRNPSLLQPTESQDTTKILESLKDLQTGGLTQEIQETLNAILEEQKKARKERELIMSKLGTTKKEIRKLHKGNSINEAVFD